MKIFLERRYPKILNEFSELYKYVDFLNPNKKNLCKTSTFKDWMAENPAPLKTILPMPHFASAVFEEDSLPTMVNVKKPSEDEKQETHSSSTSTIVSEIVNELFGPDGIPNEEDFPDLPTLNGEDEGIELNHFDELAYDIKPFDFF